MRLNARAFVLATGTLCGLALSSVTVMLHLQGLAGEWTLLPKLLPGYSVSFAGALIGFLYGFAIASIVAGLFFWLYLVYQQELLTPLITGSISIAGLRKLLLGVDRDLDKASKLWGERARERQDHNMPVIAWTDSPQVQQLYIHPSISGVAEDNWLIWVAKNYFRQPVQRALSVGCGDGCLERHALQLNIAQCFDAFDASPEAVEIARKKAAEAGVANRVNYAVADLNRCHFEAQSYDAAFAAMALHHVKELEHVLKQVRLSLKLGSLFILNEFIGPDQFQWTETQVRLANELLQRIPERYRKSLRSGTLKTRVLQPRRDEMTAGDPTESIRSSEIVPLVSDMFEVVERVDYGGTIVNLVLEEIAGNFRWSSEDVAILQMLFDAEKRLLHDKVIPSDFTLIIARRPDQ